MNGSRLAWTLRALLPDSVDVTPLQLARRAALGVLAADEVAPNYTGLAQYGVLGIFASLLLWFAIMAIRREQARADRMEQEVNRLNGLFQEKVLPALLSATTVLEEYTQLLRDQQQDQQRARYTRWARGDTRDREGG